MCRNTTLSSFHFISVALSKSSINSGEGRSFFYRIIIIKYEVKGVSEILSHDIFKKKCYNILKKTPVITRLMFSKVGLGNH